MVINGIFAAYKSAQRQPDTDTSRSGQDAKQAAFSSFLPNAPLAGNDYEALKMLASLKLQAQLGLTLAQQEDRRSSNRRALTQAMLDKQQAYNSDIDQLIDIQNIRATDLVS